MCGLSDDDIEYNVSFLHHFRAIVLIVQHMSPTKLTKVIRSHNYAVMFMLNVIHTCIELTGKW